MAELPYMSVQVADAIADASDMTNEELGALIRIRWAMWRAGGMLDEKRLHRFARAGKRWGLLYREIAGKLFVAGGKVSCPVVMDLIKRTRDRREKRAAAGRKGGEARARRMRSEAPQKPDQESPLNGRNPLESYIPTPSLARNLSQHRPRNQNQERDISLTSSESVTPTAKEQSMEDLLSGGAKMLAKRGGISRRVANSRIHRWLGVIHGDAVRLSVMFGEAEELGLSGTALVMMIQNQVNTAKDQEAPKLPFGLRQVG